MIVDVNVNLSRWPFRRLPFDQTTSLVAKLRENQITEAWAGSFDGLLHRDVAAVNARLADECRKFGGGLLRAVGTVNPGLPDWQEDLRRCHEVHRMHAIRINPNYHGYQLDDPVCDELFRLADERRMIVQLALKMEDVRTHHPLMQVPTVDPQPPLAALVAKYPDLRLIVMNNYGTIRADTAARLAEAGQVFFEISHAEQVGALEKLVEQVPYQRLLFGSHFPFFNLEASLLKFRESQLGGFMVEAIQRGSAETRAGRAVNPRHLLGALTKIPRMLTLLANMHFPQDAPTMPTREQVSVTETELGKAVFALRHFKSDVKVATITGTVIEGEGYGSEYCMEFGAGRSLEAAAPFRFLNHSCDPNCELINWEGETPEDLELCLHSIKAIKPGDELTIDYAWPEDAAIPCLCRSEKCRGWIVAEAALPLVQA